MKLACHSIDEFLDCIEHELVKSSLFQDAIRVSIFRRPMGKNPRKSVRFEVVLQAAAIVEVNTGGQFIVEYGTVCGIDYEDDSQEKTGTELADAVKSRLKSFTDSHDLKLLPGAIVE